MNLAVFGMVKITFDKAAKKEFLELIDKEVDEDGMIVEKSNPNQRVVTFDGQEISIDEFGGVKKGSEVFIKNNIVSLMRLLKR